MVAVSMMVAGWCGFLLALLPGSGGEERVARDSTAMIGSQSHSALSDQESS